MRQKKVVDGAAELLSLGTHLSTTSFEEGYETYGLDYS
jgi:hypothetical protein